MKTAGNTVGSASGSTTLGCQCSATSSCPLSVRWWTSTLTKLSGNASLLGLAWRAVGVVYLGFLTPGFRQALPELARRK